MSRRIFHMIVGCLCLIALGCEEVFNPKMPFESKPVLYCIVSGSIYGPGAQEAILMRTYDVGGFDPNRNRVDPTVHGARVWLTLGSNDYPMVETVLGSSELNRYGTPQAVYHARRVPIVSGSRLTITAEYPTGERLRAETTVPRFLYFDQSYRFPSGLTTTLNRLNTGKAWTLSWVAPDDHLFQPELSLQYYVQVDSLTRQYGSIEIPLRFVQDGGSVIPVYPADYTYEHSCSYEFGSFDWAMAKISEGDPDKGRYTVLGLTFSVVAYDGHLSRYYSSVHGSLDEFSVRVDETTYTNLNGGIGIFGSLMDSFFQYDVDRLYIQSFGYTAP